MKQKPLRKTQKGLKGTSESKSKSKAAGHGGARPGAGRSVKEYESKLISINLPIILLQGMEQANIDNRTAYISYLIAKDLTNRVTANDNDLGFKTIARNMRKMIYRENIKL